MSAVNLEKARQNMVEQQVRPWDVLDPKVLEVIETLPRETFTPSAYKDLAYADTEIPLGNGQCMMHPVLEGRMLQSLDIQPGDRVLEIGTGSGYITACLAKLAAHVDSIEIDAALSQAADSKLKQLGISNVSLSVADATEFTPTQQYDAIAITGAMAELSDTLKQALNVGGRLFVITGEDPVMQARLITRIAEDTWAEQIMFETSLKCLVHAEKKPQFSF